MYSENNRRSASQRANDELLRRMMGGQLTGDALPVMNATPSKTPDRLPVRDERVRVSCNGTARENGTQGAGNTACPTCIPAPSIAMVYAPKQYWRNLLDPASGLSQGSIFAELILPLEAVPQKGEKEVRARRPM